ncbi:CHRD domain-containing protein [Halomicrococcus gelatinilyticus]|uniref:CHRD domain-containing protein n=1 Tax=Halomicrococcus gelatinilyticus TaxID=1702103 RepID=UPI002E114843
MVDRRDVLRAGAAAAGGATVTASAQDGSPTYSAGRMTGDQQPDSVETDAEGALLLSRRGDSMRYVLLVTGVEDVTQAHIHRGEEGKNGPVVTWLYPGPRSRNPQRIPGRFDGVLAEGEFGAGALVGPLGGGTLDDLVAAVENRGAFVQVHTKANPAGEIRGQLGGVGSVTVQFRNRVEVEAGDGFGFQRSVQLQIQQRS